MDIEFMIILLAIGVACSSCDERCQPIYPPSEEGKQQFEKWNRSKAEHDSLNTKIQ